MSTRQKIGRGNPPRKSQFKKGQSGNPKGRPKKNCDFDSLLHKELKKPVQVSEGGRIRKRSKAEALVVTAVNKGLSGDLRAAGMLFNMHNKAEIQISDTRADEPLPEEEIAILKRYFLTLIKRLGLTDDDH